jgi:glutaredoxin
MIPQVTLYTRRGCHLCDEVKAELTRAASKVDFRLQEIDIDTDPKLVRQFNDEIPVVFVGDKKAFKYHMDEARFSRLLKG